MNALARSRIGLVVALAVLPAVAAERGAAEGLTRVTYVTASSVYVDAGTEEGLNVGDRLELLRDGEIAALLEVTFASAHKAVCSRVASDVAVSVGDVVRFTPRFPTVLERAPARPAATPAVEPEARRRPANLHGRIGLRFFAARQRGGAEYEYRQPALDLRLDGTRIFGQPLDVGIDMRARRTWRTRGDGVDESEGRTRIYQAALAWQQPGGPLRVTLGRQFSPSLAVVSLFDGLSAEYRRERFGAGVFTGSQPDPFTMGYATDVREHGAFLEFRSPRGAERRWALTTGAVGSYEDGEINREFAYLQGRFDARRLSVYATAEVDVNRGWRKEAGEDALSRSGSFVSVRWRLLERWSVDLGADDRRNVRLYRDFVSPETEFDDRWRRGYWVGVSGGAGRHLRFGIDARRSSAEGEDAADALTARLTFDRFTSWDLGASVRVTGYENPRLKGALYSLALSTRIAERSRLELRGGVRDETILAASIPEETHFWYGFDWDVLLGRRWLAIVSYERNQDQDENTDQLYTTVSYRF